MSGVLRALTLIDVLNQLNTDSSADVPYDANEVINQLAAVDETLVVGSESLTATTTTNYPVNIVQDVGPVGYWRMDDAVSSTIADDSNPWGNSTTYPKLPATVHGTVTFGATGAMTGSNAAQFDGSTGYLEIPNTGSLRLTGDLGIECWLNTSSLAAAQVIVSKGTNGEYHLRLNTNGSISYGDLATGLVTVVPAASISVGNWYHLAVSRTLSGTTLNVYLNGSSTFSGGYTLIPSPSSNVVRWGADATGAAASFFNGYLDECCIYARPLSATQAAAHYAWGTAPDVGSTPWGTARWGEFGWPVPGAASGAVYGTAKWGSFTWA